VLDLRGIILEGNNPAGTHSVNENSAFSFTAIAIDANSVMTVFVNGVELAPISDNFYYIDGIRENKLITFSLTAGTPNPDTNPTSNEELSAAKISASVGSVIVETPKDATVSVVSFSGSVVYNAKVAGTTTVNVPAGIYAVVVDRTVTKVVVR